MAKDQTKRLTDAVLQADRDAFVALQAIKDYSPSNSAYSATKAQAAHDNMIGAQEAEVQASNALAAARDDANQSEWAFHNFMLTVKEQVIAQYGSDSNEVAAVGLKKKSEYKAPQRNGRSVPAPAH